MVTCILLKQVNSLFPSSESKKFAGEKGFLICTLTFFSLSYLIMVLRNVISFEILSLKSPQDKMEQWLCETNLRLLLFNIECSFLTELLPYMIIFCLNFRNFRQMERNQQRVGSENTAGNDSKSEYTCLMLQRVKS